MDHHLVCSSLHVFSSCTDLLQADRRSVSGRDCEYSLGRRICRPLTELQGEVIARLVVHATMEGSETSTAATICTNASSALESLSREEALALLERIANAGSTL